MLTKFKLFEDNYFESYKDSLSDKPIENPNGYSINCPQLKGQ